ncbi:uncharacterized protein LOC120373593 [Mauremys reevesii]|uniref:uncharacterized protein LOC120373593 n=1 Tax=Mauremys reevesii TaxID=260615 RepID=UPI00193FDFE0|nr:uncharacterized protein LOC120373593 [Mauremys reevesii]
MAIRLPDAPPSWGHSSEEDQRKHHEYAMAVVQGMKRCIRKIPNWAKLYNVRQEKNENPAAFYERLCNTCKRYTDLDPEDDNGKREGSCPVRIRQYPLKLTTRIGLKPLIQKFVQCGWLREGTSPYNTPIMGVPKPNGQYRLVQDLRQVNKLIEAPYPVVPNPHTILGQVPKNHGWFSVIDLKDAFFSIPLDLESQKLFAFEWEDPDTHYKAQYLWTVVPQGLTCAPENFGSQLRRDLAPFLARHPACNIVQYCDDLLLSTETEQSCKEQTVELLNFLGAQGYKVSREKAQLVKQQVTFLGYHLCQGSRRLGSDRIQAILDSPQPRNPRELRAFLGLTGFCRLWIPDYGGKARPLYEALTKEGLLHWRWTKEKEKAFQELKKALVQPPALALPDPRKPFTLYVHERAGVASGVLCQKSGPTWRPIGYYSRVLDPVARGWPACLQAVAATALLVQEAEKLTLGGDTEVVVPHGVPQILGTGAGDRHLNPSRHTKYERTNQKGSGPPVPMGGRPWAAYPFQRWQVDFAEVPPCRGYKYLLVFVDQLTGWVECFPTRHCQAWAVTKALLHEILPRFHLPEVIESDRGSHFISQVVQQVAQALGIQWKLHTPWRPQSSGQVERMNRTLKDTLTKLCMESGLKWPDALPLALTRIRRAPRKGLRLSPFEFVFGFPPRVLIPGFREDVNWEVGNDSLWKKVSALQSVLFQLHRYAAPFQALPLDRPVHSFQIDDRVLIKKWKRDPLTSRWEGPYTVSLISQAAVKVLGNDKWTHYTQVKRFASSDPEDESTEEDNSPLLAPAPDARGDTGEDSNWEYQGLEGLKGLFKRRKQ